MRSIINNVGTIVSMGLVRTLALFSCFHTQIVYKIHAFIIKYLPNSPTTIVDRFQVHSVYDNGSVSVTDPFAQCRLWVPYQCATNNQLIPA